MSLNMRASPSGKASAFQADIRGSESRRPLFKFCCLEPVIFTWAHSSAAERTAHNRLAVGSIPTGPTNTQNSSNPGAVFCF
jgi:hypothetical protein